MLWFLTDIYNVVFSVAKLLFVVEGQNQWLDTDLQTVFTVACKAIQNKTLLTKESVVGLQLCDSFLRPVGPKFRSRVNCRVLFDRTVSLWRALLTD